MADVAIGRLRAILTADTTEFDKRMRAASRTVDRTASDFQRVGRTLSTHLTLPLLAAGTAFVKASADFETSMTGVAKTVDATQGQLRALGQRFVELSERIPISANALAKLGEAAGQLGVRFSAIPEFVETVAALGVSTNLAAEDAATAFARLANVMGTSQDDFDRLGSVVVELGNNLATTEREITELGVSFAPVARTIGLTEAQVLAFAGAISSVGIEAQAGAGAISRAFVAMQQAVQLGTTELQVFSRVVGVSGEEFSQLFERDAAQAMAAFVRGLENLRASGGNVSVVLKELGLDEIRVRRALLGLAGANEVLTRALDLSAEAWEENTALTEEAQKFYDRLAASFQTLANQATNVAAEIGDSMRPAIEDAIDLARGLLDSVREAAAAFGSLDESTRKAFVAMIALAAALGPAAIAAGIIVGALRPLVALLPLMAAAIGGPGALLGALALAAGALIGGVVLWDKLRDAMDRAKTTTGQVGEAFRDLVPDIRETARIAAESLDFIQATAEASRIEIELTRARAGTIVDAELIADLLERREEVRGRLQDLADKLGPLQVGTTIQLTADERTRLGVGTGGAGVGAGTTAGLSTLVSQIAEVRQKLEKEFEKIAGQSLLLGARFDEAAARASVLEKAIVDLLDKGVDPSHPLLQQLARDLSEIHDAADRAASLESVGDILGDIANKIRAVRLDPLTLDIEQNRRALLAQAAAAGLDAEEIRKLVEVYDELAEQLQLDTAAKQAEDTADEVSQAFLNAFENLQREVGNIFTEIFDDILGLGDSTADKLVGIFTRALGEVLAAQLAQSVQGALSQAINPNAVGQTAAQQQAARQAQQSPAAGVGGQLAQTGGLGGILQGSLSGQNAGPAIAALAGIALAAVSIASSVKNLNDDVGSGLSAANEQLSEIGPLVGGIVGLLGGIVAGYSLGGVGGIGAGATLGANLGANFFGIKASRAAERASSSEKTVAAIGGVLFPLETFLLGLILGKFKKVKADFQAKTIGIPADEITNRILGFGVGAPSPFGTVGVSIENSKRLNREFAEAISQAIADVDDQIAQLLTTSEIAQVGQFIQTHEALTVSFSKFDNEVAQVITDRLKAVVTALEGADVTANVFAGLPSGEKVKTEDLQAIQDAFDEFIEIRNILKELRGEETADQLSEVAQAIDEVSHQFAVFAAQVERLGLATHAELVALEEVQLEQIRQGFRDEIARQIRAITDPFGLAAEELAAQQEERLRNAIDAGADLVEIERLNLLERERLVEQFGSNIEAFLKDLLAGPSSPLAPTVALGNAEALFNEVRDAVTGGETARIPELVDSARNLLDVSRGVFASSEQFFQRFDFVVATLQNVIGTQLALPGFQHGGSFRVGGIGGPDSQLVAFRATPGETVDVGRQGARSGDDSLARAIVEGNADRNEFDQRILDEIKGLRKAVASQQAALDRFTAATGARMRKTG